MSAPQSRVFPSGFRQPPLHNVGPIPSRGNAQQGPAPNIGTGSIPNPTLQQSANVQQIPCQNSHAPQDQPPNQPHQGPDINGQGLALPPQQPINGYLQGDGPVYPPPQGNPTQAHVDFSEDRSESDDTSGSSSESDDGSEHDPAPPIDQLQQTLQPDPQIPGEPQSPVQAWVHEQQQLSGFEERRQQLNCQQRQGLPSNYHQSQTNSLHTRSRRAQSIQMPPTEGVLRPRTSHRAASDNHDTRMASRSKPLPESNNGRLARRQHGLGRGEANVYYDQNQSLSTNTLVGGEAPLRRPREHSHRHSHHRPSHRRHRRSSPIRRREIDEFISRSSLKPGFTGYLKGMWHLAMGKPYVREDTPERLDLLDRADHFFNSGITRIFVNKEKAGRFREDMDRVARTLRREQTNKMEHGRHGSGYRSQRSHGQERHSERRDRDYGRSTGDRHTMHNRRRHHHNSPRLSNGRQDGPIRTWRIYGTLSSDTGYARYNRR